MKEIEKHNFPFDHIIVNKFLPQSIFDSLIDTLPLLEWQKAQSEEYLKDNSTIPSTVKVISELERTGNGFHIFSSADFVQCIADQLNVPVTTLSSVVFLKMTTGFYNHIHSDENDFGELARLILYISEPSAYSGGDLVLHDVNDNHISLKIKFDSNTLFGFKMGSNSYHSVEEITDGERICLALTYS